MKSRTHGWAIFYFSISIAIFALVLVIPLASDYSPTEEADNASSPDALITGIICGIPLLLSLIPLLIILFGKKTPRNWKRLLGWIIVESLYNPLFGIPLWIAWCRKGNRDRFGDELAWKQEAVEAGARRVAARERSRRRSAGIRKLASEAVALNAAAEVYKKLSPKQRENAIKAGLHVGALAALNPDKVKQVKNAIGNLGKPKDSSGGTGNALERMQELNALYKNDLISSREYESKKAEIISDL